MKYKFLVYMILVFGIYSCNQKHFKEEYYANGNLKLKAEVNEQGSLNGSFKEFYDSGNLKLSTSYVKGFISDSVYHYYENENLKEKGLMKDEQKIGWWFYYDKNGLLKFKKEFKINDNLLFLNQDIHYKSNGKIDSLNSSFFKLNIDDTIVLGPNKGTINYYSNIKDYTDRYMYVILENQYSETLIKKDTFTEDIDKLWFGIYAHKVGDLLVTGVIEEQLVYYKKTIKDSAELTIDSKFKYFEKKVYVKDTLE